MNTFAIVVSSYSIISILLLGLMLYMGRCMKSDFRAEYGDQSGYESADEESRTAWGEVQDEKYNSGFFRFVALAFVIFHLPGFIITVWFSRGTDMDSWIMALVTDIVYLALAYWLFF